MSVDRSGYDAIIIGGGPAGISAALWCSDLGLKPLLIERRTELGGQLLWTFNAITNYPGFVVQNGREMRDRFLQSIEDKEIEILLSANVDAVDLKEKAVRLVDGRQFTGRSIVIATGVRRRKLDVPGEDIFYGKGIMESGAKYQNAVAGKTVVIVGGGDAALENASILSEVAEKVVVVHRGKTFSARHEFVESAKQRSNIGFHLGCRIAAIVGDSEVAVVEIVDSVTGKTSRQEADFVLIRIGVEPNTELFTRKLEMDEKSYLIADRACSTSSPGVFAIGDVVNSNVPTISTSVGDAAVAARAILCLKESARSLKK